MGDKTALGDRMKGYEDIPRTSLTPRMPMLIRVDGKAFHTYTRGFDRPWDLHIRDGMTAVAAALLDEVQGAKLAYVQSDEVSILCTDYDKLTSSAWFDKNVQKCASVSASIATAAFNEKMSNGKRGLFDSRVFVVPREEVCNYFVWRQQDATRNSISMLAQSEFSHKQLHGKSTGAMQEMLMTEKGINWNDCEVWQKRGWCVTRKTVYRNVATGEVEPCNLEDTDQVVRTVIEPDWEIPIFTADRDYVERLLVPKEE